MASGARDLTARNNENTPDDPEDAANTRRQGDNFNRVGSDAATIDDTLTQVQGAANTLVQDAARATQLNSQVSAGAAAVEATLGRTEARIAQMQGQNAEARAQLEAVRERPAEVSEQAGAVGAEGQDLVQSSRDIEARLHAVQQRYAAGMASVPAPRQPRESEAAPPAEASPAAEPSAAEAEPPAAVPEVVAPTEETALVETGPPSGAGANAGEPPPPPETPPSEPTASESEDVLIQRQPEAGAARQQSDFDLGEWVGLSQRNEAERARQQREHEVQRQRDLDQIESELRGRRFEQLSAGERRMLALRVSTRNMFSWLSNISWPTPGGIARGAAHLAVGLIDPRGPMMGVVSGFNMIINNTINFARQPSLGGALRLAINIATGLAIILGSITALAGVIAAAMTALTILTVGIAAPFAGPIIAFCASVMSVVGGWTFWVGLLAAGFQALTFLVDLYMAGTAQTAEQLQQQSERMREDASNAGNALLQAGMGRLAQVGGRHMQRAIWRAGGGVRFAARMGARGPVGRVTRGVRLSGGVRGYAGRLRTSASEAFGRFRTRVAEAGGYGAYARRAAGEFGGGVRDLGRSLWRELRSGGPRDVPGRQGFSHDFLLGRDIPRLPRLRDLRPTMQSLREFGRGVRATARGMRDASAVTRMNVYIDDILTRGVVPVHPSAARVARAQAAVNAGTATERDLQVLVQKAVADARTELSLSSRRAQLDWNAVCLRCGPGRDVSAASFGSLAMDSPRPISLRRFQAEDVFGVNKHGFNVVTVPGNPPQRYLVDPTFAQFMRPGRAIPSVTGPSAEIIRDEVAGAAFARDLARDGYVPLTQENAALYARALGVPEAEAAAVGRRLESGSYAVTDEVVGGRAADLAGGADPGPIALAVGREPDIVDAREVLGIWRQHIAEAQAAGDPGNLLPTLRDMERRLMEVERRAGVNPPNGPAGGSQ